MPKPEPKVNSLTTQEQLPAEPYPNEISPIRVKIARLVPRSIQTSQHPNLVHLLAAPTKWYNILVYAHRPSTQADRLDPRSLENSGCFRNYFENLVAIYVPKSPEILHHHTLQTDCPRELVFHPRGLEDIGMNFVIAGVETPS